MSFELCLRRTILTGMGLGLLIIAATCQTVRSEDGAPTPRPRVSRRSADLAESKEWRIQITPRLRFEDREPNSSDDAVGIGARRITVSDYKRIYDAIPFSRTEYEANPSYRHETAMEILFGELRPMTIHKYQPQVQPRMRRQQHMLPYRYNRHLIPYGLNYYFYFPYWNALGHY